MPIRSLNEAQARTLEAFAAEVRESPHNLVSRRARDELMERHVPEAVALARLLPAGGQRLLDVGSGGGLPGMVIAVVRPELEVHLLDATAKKVRFLEATADRLGVPVTVHHGRAEEVAQGPLRAGFDLVTARAVAPLGDLLAFTLPFLTPAGVVYAIKGERWSEELQAARQALRRLGGTVLATPDDLSPGPGDDPDGVAPRVVMLGRAR